VVRRDAYWQRRCTDAHTGRSDLRRGRGKHNESSIGIAGERHHHIQMTDPRAIMAARNNADWYAMMFDVHGLRYHRSEIAFLALDTPPPYHSWMTTLDPTANRALLELISRNLDRPGFGLKDAFHCLELRPHGLIEYFSATRIWADTLQPTSAIGWTRITSPIDLLLWEAAWKDGGSPSDRRQFPVAILGRPDVYIWGRTTADGFDAGLTVVSDGGEDLIAAYPHARTDAGARIKLSDRRSPCEEPVSLLRRLELDVEEAGEMATRRRHGARADKQGGQQPCAIEYRPAILPCRGICVGQNILWLIEISAC